MTLILTFLCTFIFIFHGVDGNVEMKFSKENEPVTLTCGDYPATVFWLRLRENGQGFEYTGSYSKSKREGKVNKDMKDRFVVKEKTLEVTNFQQQQDSGTYSCLYINNNELKFSAITELRGETIPTTSKPKIKTTRMQTAAVTANVMTCGPKSKGETRSNNTDGVLGCPLHIFISLVAGCGFLLLALLITILYCNRIRTRRCPHHYKRQPRGRPAGHKALPNPADY